MYVYSSLSENWESCQHYFEGQHSRDKRYCKYGEGIKKASWICSSVLVTERIICSYDTFSPIIAAEVWLENVEWPCPIKEQSSTFSVNSHFRHWLSEWADKLHFALSDLFPSSFLLLLSLTLTLSLTLPPPISAPLSLSLIILNEIRDVHWIFEYIKGLI